MKLLWLGVALLGLVCVESAIAKNNYPVRFTYIDKLSQWWPPEKIAAGMGVPGYSDQKIYNYYALAFWGCKGGIMDVALVWANADTYFGTDSPFGSTKDAIQKHLRKRYNDAGAKIMVSAFGATQMPTTYGEDPVQCAQKLASFVKDNNLDGADIDWQDNDAMEAGTGEEWLITFTQVLRDNLPTQVITHAPQAPYFKKEYYKNGGYITIHKAVGSLINFYNVQFYNQGDTKYDTYEELFLNAHGTKFNGTALKEIVARGVQAKKIVVGKPVNQGDATNTGFIEPGALGKYIDRSYADLGWYGGVMYWQYASDLSGKAMTMAAGYLKEQCAINKNCV